MGAGVGLKVGVGIVGGAVVVAVVVVVVGTPKFRVGSVGRGTEGAGAPNPVRPLKSGGLVTVSSFLAVGANPAGCVVSSRENNEGASVLVVAGGLSPGRLMAGSSIGAVFGADIEGAAKPRPNEGGGASADDEGAVVIVAAAGEGRGLLRTPCDGFGASTLGAAGGANEVVVDDTTGALGGSGIVTVMTGRLVGAAALVNPPLSEPAPATLESVTRALSFSNTLASASRFSIMLSRCRPCMPFPPAWRAHDSRPLCMPDQLGILPPGVVVICRTVITVPPFLAGVLGFPPVLESETAVWLPVVVSLVVVVVDEGARRESRFDRPGVVGIELMTGLGLVGRLELDTPRILPLFHISALPGESLPDPGSFGEDEGNGTLFSFPGSCSSSSTE